MDSPAAVAAASAAVAAPVRICLSDAFCLRFWLIWCEGRLLFAAIEGGMHAGNARLRSGCLRRSVADSGDYAADGNAGQVPIGYSAAEAVLLLDRASAVQLPLAGSGLVIMGTYDCSF